MSTHPVFPIAQEVIALLDRAGVDYMLMGGLAVRFWAIPRPTYDVDVTVAADDARAAELLTRFDAAGFEVPEEFKRGWFDTLSNMRKFTVRRFVDRDAWRVDVFLVTTEYQKAAFARRTRAKFLGSDVWTISAEDLILHKLVAGREKDLVDVNEMLALVKVIDMAYLRVWAERLSVAEALEDRLKKSGRS